MAERRQFWVSVLTVSVICLAILFVVDQTKADKASLTYFLFRISDRAALCQLLEGVCVSPWSCAVYGHAYTDRYRFFPCNSTTICCWQPKPFHEHEYGYQSGGKVKKKAGDIVKKIVYSVTDRALLCQLLNGTCTAPHGCAVQLFSYDNKQVMFDCNLTAVCCYLPYGYGLRLGYGGYGGHGGYAGHGGYDSGYDGDHDGYGGYGEHGGYGDHGGYGEYNGYGEHGGYGGYGDDHDEYGGYDGDHGGYGGYGDDYDGYGGYDGDHGGYGGYDDDHGGYGGYGDDHDGYSRDRSYGYRGGYGRRKWSYDHRKSTRGYGYRRYGSQRNRRGAAYRPSEHHFRRYGKQAKKHGGISGYGYLPFLSNKTLAEACADSGGICTEPAQCATGSKYAYKRLLCNLTAICCLPDPFPYGGDSRSGYGDEEAKIRIFPDRLAGLGTYGALGLDLLNIPDRIQLCAARNGTCLNPEICIDGYPGEYYHGSRSGYSRHRQFYCNLTTVCCLPKRFEVYTFKEVVYEPRRPYKRRLTHKYGRR